ncbi:hypothetical protein SAMN05428964_10544 [Thalassospira xiamenensis]|uniref:Uncharacterized protein n=1 Tax=Thalassospira xiamenensis TaxID=220697 RepID=A0A285TSU1_9PROT|nr:hypothetical protein SAMN05428964_10544 [Thalassospira xiamenensis]
MDFGGLVVFPNVSTIFVEFDQPLFFVAAEFVPLVEVIRNGIPGFFDPLRDKPRRSGRGRIARAAQPCLVLVRRLLLFDVLAHDGDWRPAAA